ncbi:glycoside hydrolase 43 family protein [Bacteroides nordii]|uniref:glycoside hydrolase family 43 protein n=1 Tax=Bacteroides nordii TaxID=291645 RepID=UPI002A7F78CA|nr:glycoside hydrolase 43 family protein [Bacteroides nordii]
MKNIFSLKKSRSALSLVLCCLPFITITAQQMTAFERVGTDDESIQEFFPGEHRARPVLGAYTNSGYMGLFCGGQDLGGSSGWYIDPRWGDLGDGMFANPILNGDYSDPDVIRVGSKYYMICSEFHFMGIPVLESDDMVNWTIVGQIYNHIDLPGFSEMKRYGDGSWAPALRYHDGKFWMFVCMPNDGLFMSTATNAAGPWPPLYCVKSAGGWEDPCPLWDDDGQAYVGRSQLGGGPIYIHKMSADGTRLLDDGKKVYEGPVAEGTKLFKKDGYYYISIPEGGVSSGWQTVMRSKNIYGPYESKRVLEMGVTKVNGPHQGALVDTPEGEWWFYHFQSADPQGRVVHLQPVVWEDGFPVIGTDYDKNGIGEPVKVCKKPAVKCDVTPHAPQASDDFSSDKLAVQWQFNHNPANENWSLTSRPGWLEIKALKAESVRDSRNQFTQKTMGYKGEAIIRMDYSAMTEGQRAGLECIGNKFCGAGVLVQKDAGTLTPVVYYENEGQIKLIKTVEKGGDPVIYVKLAIDALNNKHQFSYSLDGQNYLECGDSFQEGSRDWKGSRVGLYSYNTKEEGGSVWFDSFEYKFDGPGGLVTEE